MGRCLGVLPGSNLGHMSVGTRAGKYAICSGHNDITIRAVLMAVARSGPAYLEFGSQVGACGFCSIGARF